MAKTKKSSAKATAKTKTSTKKVTNPLDAPRLKAPEDDLPPVPPQPTIGGLLKRKLAGFWQFIARHKKKVAIAVLILVVGGWVLSNYLQTRDQLNKLADPKTSSQTVINIITDQIRDAIDVPNETPTLATVSDVERLRSQVFFKNAENGDKVLIYAQACKAVLYRQSTKKIIAVMSACGNDGQNQQSQNSTQNQQQTQQNSQSQGTQLQTQTPQTPQQ